jgi:hypothetical protein
VQRRRERERPDTGSHRRGKSKEADLNRREILEVSQPDWPARSRAASRGLRLRLAEEAEAAALGRVDEALPSLGGVGDDRT